MLRKQIALSKPALSTLVLVESDLTIALSLAQKRFYDFIFEIANKFSILDRSGPLQVIDIGSGDGRVWPSFGALARNNLSLQGIEIEPGAKNSMRQRAKAVRASFGAKFGIVIANAENLKSIKGIHKTADCITILHPFMGGQAENTTSLSLQLKSAYQNLRPGGIIVMTHFTKTEFLAGRSACGNLPVINAGRNRHSIGRSSHNR
ncbi:MAG: SAM-dependent methyltransferase [Candidatus Marinamargulisbacteria bacterium]|jgi:SAM-dependent methyltransferase